MTANIDLLLITGAGASRDFGGNHRPLPLMAEFSDAIVSELRSMGRGFLEVTKLDQQLDGPEFEQRLGAFLQAYRALPRIERILSSTATFPNVQLPEHQIKTWYDNSRIALDQVVGGIYKVAYEQFAQERVATAYARMAYDSLFQVLGIDDTKRVAVVTTNYDLIADNAIEEIGRRTDNGNPRNPNVPVRVERLLEGGTRHVPVLHLHGCLGWYRRSDDDALMYFGGGRYEPQLGGPVMVLPDPEKSYGDDPAITSLWDQFAEALRAATRVLVIGHSLNDQLLVQRIVDNLDTMDRLGVTILPDLPNDDPLRRTIREKLRGAREVPLRFTHPLAVAAESPLEDWRNMLRTASPRA